MPAPERLNREGMETSLAAPILSWGTEFFDMSLFLKIKEKQKWKCWTFPFQNSKNITVKKRLFHQTSTKKSVVGVAYSFTNLQYAAVESTAFLHFLVSLSPSISRHPDHGEFAGCLFSWETWESSTLFSWQLNNCNVNAVFFFPKKTPQKKAGQLEDLLKGTF